MSPFGIYGYDGAARTQLRRGDSLWGRVAGAVGSRNGVNDLQTCGSILDQPRFTCLAGLIIYCWAVPSSRPSYVSPGAPDSACPCLPLIPMNLKSCFTLVLHELCLRRVALEPPDRTDGRTARTTDLPRSKGLSHLTCTRHPLLSFGSISL